MRWTGWGLTRLMSCRRLPDPPAYPHLNNLHIRPEVLSLLRASG